MLALGHGEPALYVDDCTSCACVCVCVPNYLSRLKKILQKFKTPVIIYAFTLQEGNKTEYFLVHFS